jgi:hypothetical protein
MHSETLKPEDALDALRGASYGPAVPVISRFPRTHRAVETPLVWD